MTPVVKKQSLYMRFKDWGINVLSAGTLQGMEIKAPYVFSADYQCILYRTKNNITCLTWITNSFIKLYFIHNRATEHLKQSAKRLDAMLP